MNNFDIPSGFTACPDGRGGFVISRPPIKINYPCGICGLNRSEMWNLRASRLWQLPCHRCDPQAYDSMVEQIRRGEL